MIKSTVFAVCALFCALAFNSCGTGEKNHKGEFAMPPSRPYIVATTGMIADAVRAIVGDSADVVALMGPGVDPHLFKATQGDLEHLKRADIIFYNGLHLEGKMGDVLEKLARNKPVVAVSKRIPESLLHSVDNGIHDPHIWFDVKLWQQAVLQIADTLRSLDLPRRNVYQRNATAYLAQLDSLHTWVYKEIASIPEQHRVLVTAHDAFGYFGSAYHIKVEGLQGISTMSEYGPRDITRIVDEIVGKKIKAVFVESSVPRRSIEAVVAGCRERGHNVTIGGELYSDALGAAGTPEGTYTGMVRANVQTITTALR